MTFLSRQKYLILILYEMFIISARFFLCFHVLFQQQSAIWRGYITSLSGDGVSTAIAKLTSVTLCLKVSIVPTCMEEDVFRNVMEIEILTDSATTCDFATPREKLVIMLQLT